MVSHMLVASQFVGQAPEVVVPFFERPQNLARMTPSSMAMRIVSSDLQMRDGLEIDYTLQVLPFLTTSWRTRIVAYDPPRGFTDVQLKGPYRRWEHRHDFVP